MALLVLGSAVPAIDVVLDDRRSAERLPLRGSFLVAPFTGDGNWKFTEVQGRDVSTRGISFYTIAPFDSRLAAVELQSGAETFRLLMKVVWTGQESVNRRTMYAVGCRLLRRLP
jgi:hypothetical protein